MSKINYYSHLLLNNKYKTLFSLMFYFICVNLHYLYFDSLDIASCMPTNKKNIQQAIKEFENLYGNNYVVHTVKKNIINDNIPILAEVKEVYRPSHQVIALTNEIKKFAGTHISLLEQIDKQAEIIEEQKEELVRQKINMHKFEKLENQVFLNRMSMLRAESVCRKHIEFNTYLIEHINKLKEEINILNEENQMLHDELLKKK